MKKRSMWILGGLVAILFIVVVVICIKILFYPSGKGIYGNRLEGMENYPISNEKIEEVKNTLLASDDCQTITYQLQGKIMKFFIQASDETGTASAQRLGDNIIDSFSETELAYYDVAIYITGNSENEQYPMLGYKSKNKASINWTVNKGETDEK